MVTVRERDQGVRVVPGAKAGEGGNCGRVGRRGLRAVPGDKGKRAQAGPELAPLSAPSDWRSRQNAWPQRAKGEAACDADNAAERRCCAGSGCPVLIRFCCPLFVGEQRQAASCGQTSRRGTRAGAVAGAGSLLPSGGGEPGRTTDCWPAHGGCGRTGRWGGRVVREAWFLGQGTPSRLARVAGPVRGRGTHDSSCAVDWE